MNARMISRLVIALGLCLVLASLFIPSVGFAAGLASDQASNPAYSGVWTNGSSGGVGWGTGGWQLFVAGVQTSIPTANFILSSTNNNASGHTNVVGDIDTAGVAWGMQAPSFTQDVRAIRFFNGSLTNGQRFTVAMDNGFVPTDQFVAFYLHNTNLQTRLQFLATNQTYVLQGPPTGVAAIPTGITNTDEGLKIEVQLVDSNTVNVFVTNLVAGTQSAFSNVTLATVAGTKEIGGVSFVNTGAGAGATNQAFFNSITILPNPADTNLFADLAIDKTVSPNPVITSSNLTYTVTVTNNGPADATAVTVTDVPPMGITFTTTPSQGTCTNIAGQIVCDLGIVSNNAIASITLISNDLTNAPVTINDSPSLQLTNAMTLEAWVFPTTVIAVWGDVIMKGQDDYYLEGTSSFEGGPPATGSSFGPPLPSPTALVANTWTHLAATYDGATILLYVNGVQVASQSQTGDLPVSNNALTIGGDPFFTQHFDGRIDEIRLYNRALSAVEIQNDLNTPVVGSPAPGLVAAYGFNEGTGATVADASGNNNTGTISGATWTTAGKYGNALSFVGAPFSGGAITNTAVVTALNVDPNPTNNVVTNIVSVITLAALSVSPANSDFGTIATGTTAQVTFVVTNSGGATLTGTVTVAVAQFAVASGSPFSIPGFGTTNVVINFTPDSVAAFTDDVVFVSNDGNSTNQVTGAGAVVPIAGFTGTPTNGVAPLDVSFTDASSGTITNQLWDFGDGGASTDVSPSHTYTNAGTFSVSLSVFGPLGTDVLTRSSYISVTSTGAVAPAASFTGTPTNGPEPLAVTFTNASTGTITNQLWNFGDSGTSTLASPSHSYTTSGTFTVSLTVFGSLGTDVLTRSSYISVTSTAVAAPVAAFTASPGNGPALLIVKFTDASTGTITNRSWSFGDGDISTAVSPTHVYTNAGSFTVSLTVRGPGGSNTVTHAIIVTGTAKNSPVGDWEVTVSGADKGIAFLILSNNATASGYEIRMKTFGLDMLSGTWGLDAKGKLTGSFIEKLGSATNWTGTLAGSAKTDKNLSASIITNGSTKTAFKWKGIPATTFPDLSGTWSGRVTIAKTAAFNVRFAITMNATNAGVFDVATPATNTVIGQFIATSKDAIAGYLSISTNQTTLSGKGKFTGSKAPSISLKGSDAGGDKINLNLIKE